MSVVFKKIKRKIFPKTLYARTLAIIVVPVFIMQLVIAFIFIDRPWDNMVDKIISSLAGEINTVSIQLNNPKTDVNSLLVIVKKNLKVDIEIGKYKELSKSGLNKSLGFAWQSVEYKMNSIFSNVFDFDFDIRTFPEKQSFEINTKLDNGKIVTFSYSHKKVISPTTHIFILWIIGTSILLMIVSVIFMKNQVRPIKRLAVAAEKLGKGQDVEYFKVEGAAEVRQASMAFLDMRSRITRQIEQRTAMLAGVSHDIKTPITRIKLQLAMMPESQDIDLIKQDLQEMETMLEGYLSFARGEGDEETEIVNIKDIISRIVVKSLRESKNVECNLQEDIEIYVRPNAIERAISNIVGNACKYAGKAWISVSRYKYAVEISIEDNGKGIPEDKREEVFKPFFRLEKSRNNKTGGVGLGLSVAQDIVHSHGGQIRLSKSENYGGLKAVIRLPL